MIKGIDKNLYTPMIRQYLDIKEEFIDSLIFFRLGDFYEMFFDDAKIASKELEIVLTGRDAGVEERVPMCGVPYHSIDNYIKRLIEKGYKVVIVDQKDNIGNEKLFNREVTRVLTPGTFISNDDQKSNNAFIASFEIFLNRIYLVYIDIVSGYGYYKNFLFDIENFKQEIKLLNIKEFVIKSEFELQEIKRVSQSTNITLSILNNIKEVPNLDYLYNELDNHYKSSYLRLLNYILTTQKKEVIHFQKPSYVSDSKYMNLSYSTIKDLEVCSYSNIEKKTTLYSILNYTKTAMGARYLKSNLLCPSKDLTFIKLRQTIVSSIFEKNLERVELAKELYNIYDLERLISKISFETLTPLDCIQIKKSLIPLEKVVKLLEKLKINSYFQFTTNLVAINDLINVIENSIVDEAPILIKEGNIFKPSYNVEIDEYRSINIDSKEYLLNFEKIEREKTGIKNLKVGYNRVFGYYIEVSGLNVSLIKDEYGYIRKQTLSNAERYITAELKTKEALIMSALEKCNKLEYDLFNEFRLNLKNQIKLMQIIAKDISELDLLLSFALAAKENKYVLPVFNSNNELILEKSRHPVLEKNISNCISNNCILDDEKNILLITGPNMAGKSTYMRQIALIVIMAQIGCFVSASFASLPIFDAIYTRIGAKDDITEGDSTFMVEMKDVYQALKSATKDSLFIFDELGRGTATYDGMALAQAIIEYISKHINCKTLFSTHYHELTILDKDIKTLKNVHVKANSKDNDIIFLYKVVDGPSNRSYGINVARLAKIPMEIILRSEFLLYNFEKVALNEHKHLRLEEYQAPLFFDSTTSNQKEVIKLLSELKIDELKPIEALNILNELKRKVKNGEN